MRKKKLLTDRSGLLQDELIDQAATDLAKAIDFQVIASMLNWVEVKVLRNSSETIKWCSKNVSGGWLYHGVTYIFENEKDANWFKIRWL